MDEIRHTSETRFADLAVGKRVEFSKVWSEEDLETFSRLTGDSSRLHSSDEHARRLGFPARVVFGLLTASLMSRLVGEELVGDNGVILTCSFRFLKPVAVGDMLEVAGDIREKFAGTSTVRVELQVRAREELVLRGEALVQVRDER